MQEEDTHGDGHDKDLRLAVNDGLASRWFDTLVR